MTLVQKEVKAVYIGSTRVWPIVAPVSETFSYTGSDQTWIVPYTQQYIITCKGAGGRSAAGGLAEGTFLLNAGDVLKIMVGQCGNVGSSGTYGFGGTASGGSYDSGGGLSGVFTGSGTITASDSARALVIGGGAGGSSAGTGGAGGGTTGGTGTGRYGTAGAGGTQTGRGSGGNAGSYQFSGGNGSGIYGYGGGGGWWGGNGSIGDSSGDDDKGGGGGSGYVKSTGTNVTLTTGGGATAGNHGSVTIVSVDTPTPTGNSYEYTFTNSSWSVIDDTWTITNQSATTYDSSYGLFRNYGTSESTLTKSIDLSGLTSQLKITWYARSRSSGGSNLGAVIGLVPNTSSAYDSGIWVHFNGYDFGIGIGNGSSANMNWKSISNTYNTDENIEATFNFSGGTASGTVRGQTVSISVGSSDLNTAKTYTGLRICTGTEWIKGIKIEWS